MSITNIKKINVRSPFYINVGNAYEIPVVEPDPLDPDPIDPINPVDPVDDDIIVPPDPVDPVEPVIPTYPINCGVKYDTGSTSGIRRYRINLAGRTYGAVSVSITDILVPMKMRIYNQGTTAGAYQTKGRDSYAAQWLEATGEDATDLTSAVGGVFPDISNTLVYNYTEAQSNVLGDYLIVELSMPIVVSNPKVEASCLAEAGTVPDPDYVYTMTIEHREDYSLNNPAVIKVNDVAYDLRYHRETGEGIRLVWDDVSPSVAPETNYFPYPQTDDLYRKSHLEWNYAEMNIIHLPESDFREAGQNVTIDTQLSVGTLSLAIRMEQRPVVTIAGVRTLLPSVKGYTAYPFIKHSKWGDTSNVNIDFESINLRPMGTIETKRDGIDYPTARVGSLVNTI